jgi:hypothetical protein
MNDVFKKYGLTISAGKTKYQKDATQEQMDKFNSKK